MIVVDDDSPDGTAALAQTMAQADRRVRCVHRVGRRGLTTACVEGILSSSAPVVAVIDADLQHDETLLPTMFATLADPALDIVVGSRYVEGGGTGDWARSRVVKSHLATRLARKVFHADLRDPLSGFFMIRRAAAVACIRAGLSGGGFKILLDLFANSPVPLRYRELPYRFRPRQVGESKLDALVAWEFLRDAARPPHWPHGAGPLHRLHDGRRHWGRRAPGGADAQFPRLRHVVPDRSGGGDAGRDDQQLRAQQPPHLPRPASARAGAS